MTVIERIDAARAQWNVLDHPFYLRWERGELSRDELAFYAGEYRHAVVALADTAKTAGDATHAAEEREHVDLWDSFASALEAPVDREPTAETEECAVAWSTNDALEAHAILYAVESSQPAISRTKLAGLVEHYGFTAGSTGTEYFGVHATRDYEHAAASAEVLRGSARGEADRLVAAATRALVGNWRLLDGVNSRS